MLKESPPLGLECSRTQCHRGLALQALPSFEVPLSTRRIPLHDQQLSKSVHQIHPHQKLATSDQSAQHQHSKPVTTWTPRVNLLLEIVGSHP